LEKAENSKKDIFVSFRFALCISLAIVLLHGMRHVSLCTSFDAILTQAHFGLGCPSFSSE